MKNNVKKAKDYVEKRTEAICSELRVLRERQKDLLLELELLEKLRESFRITEAGYD